MDRLTILVLILGSDRLSSCPIVNVNDALRLYSIGPSRVTLCRFYRIAVNVQLLVIRYRRLPAGRFRLNTEP